MPKKPFNNVSKISIIVILLALLTGCKISDMPGLPNAGEIIEKILSTDTSEISKDISEPSIGELVYGTQRVFDEADLLTDDEEVALEEYIHKAEEQTSSNIVIVTINKSLKDYALNYQSNYSHPITENKYVMVYADNFWTENNFDHIDATNGGYATGTILVDNFHEEIGTGELYTWMNVNGTAAEKVSSSDCDDILNTFFTRADTDYYQACLDYVKAYVDKMRRYGIEAEVSINSDPSIFTNNNGISDNEDSGKSYSDDRIADFDSVLASADLNNVKSVNYDIASYDGRWSYNVEYDYNCDIYDYYHKLNRYYDTLDYNRYVLDEASVEYVKQLVSDLDELYDSMDFSESDKVRECVNFVQSIAYVSDIDSAGKDEWPKYAIETLYEQNGDCEDLSILLAGILKEMDYGCCLIVFDDHVAVGLLGDETMPGAYYEMDGKMYFYIETTERGWGIGEIPDQYNGVSANIVPIR